MTEKNSESAKESLEKRIEAIKREEREDASTYYEQGQTADLSAEESYSSSPPIEPISKEQEEKSFLKTIAIVGLGAAGLALVFNFYFISDLETRFTSLSENDRKIDASLGKLDTDIKGVMEELEKATTSVSELDRKVNSSNEETKKSIHQLKSAISGYEKKMAIMELKRALVAIKGVTSNAGPEVVSSSKNVISNIEGLLKKLENNTVLATPGNLEEVSVNFKEGITAVSTQESREEIAEESEDLGEETVEESEDSSEETVEESEDSSEETAEESEDSGEETAEESEGSGEETVEEPEDSGEETAEEPEDSGEETTEVDKIKSDVIPALAPTNLEKSASHVGEIRLAAEGEEIEEELPTIEDLK